MTQREKEFSRIANLSKKSYTFQEIRKYLEFHGFYSEMNGSSHCIYRHDPYPHITIVVHQGHVGRFYVKRMVEILKENEII